MRICSLEREAKLDSTHSVVHPMRVVNIPRQGELGVLCSAKAMSYRGDSISWEGAP